MKRFKRIFFVTWVAVAAIPFVAAQIDTDKLKAMKARSIGPAGMSGRVTAIDADPRDTSILYVGTASGGLWKSTNAGITWKPIFDDQPVASIGSLAVDPNNSDVIWVGSGEGNPRNSQTVGNGIYKSLDGGNTWKHLGLDETEHIHRVIVNPNNSAEVYVAALGKTWGENPERGVYKTGDGGKTWDRVLFVNDRTGAADLVMDPRNPDKLIAALWEHRRWPWFMKSGGEGSGLYITHDGGQTWEEKTSENGLPAGELGRIGLAIAHSEPNIVYALVESKKNALYRSEDGGQSWKMINNSASIGNRPFYYSDIFVDPANANRIYSLHSRITYSDDGGKTFERMADGIHPDHHAFWVHPDDPEYLVEGNDGGLAISRDRGKSWRFVRNLPLAQFYHINVDMDRPFNVYGGLQDNGSWRGPSAIWGEGGISNADWQDVGFGDGFDVAPDPSTRGRWVYSMSQGGNLRRYDTVTGAQVTIRPPDPEDETLRFNWNAGFALDPHSNTGIYYGSQYLHKSSDRGDSWAVISPDLTTDNPERQKQLDSGGLTYDVTGAENFTTIIAIAPSPVDPQVIWVGTDDGNVQVTRDGGEHWENVVGNIAGVPEGTWVPHIEASKFEAQEAFVVFDDHRRSNWTPYVYRTNDYGRSWTSLGTDNLRGYVHVMEQDSEVSDLLFLGTEFNLYYSLDDGKSWNRWEHGLPTVAVRDLIVHPRDGDLAIATFGRAVYILDDIGPLRVMARQGADVLDSPLGVFPVPDAVQAFSRRFASGGVLFAGDAEFSGENRSRGALITYVVNPPDSKNEGEQEEHQPSDGDMPEDQDERSEEKKEEVKIEILENDNVIRTFKGPAEPGLNRASWDLRRKGVRAPGRRSGGSAQEPPGAPVLPGTYAARVSFGEHERTVELQVLADPRVSLDPAVLSQTDQQIKELMNLMEATGRAFEQVEEAEKSVAEVKKLLTDQKEDQFSELRNKNKEVGEQLKALKEQISPPEVQGIRRDPSLLTSQIFRAGSYLDPFAAPGPTEELVLRKVRSQVESYLDQVNTFFAGPWEEYRKAVEEADLKLVKEHKKIEIE